jgi:hypothetical protein
MTATATPRLTPELPAQDEIECTRERTLDRARRCVALLLSQIAGDHEHCGKAACRRSRRCRGFACEPDSNHE